MNGGPLYNGQRTLLLARERPMAIGSALIGFGIRQALGEAAHGVASARVCNAELGLAELKLREMIELTKRLISGVAA